MNATMNGAVNSLPLWLSNKCGGQSLCFTLLLFSQTPKQAISTNPTTIGAMTVGSEDGLYVVFMIPTKARQMPGTMIAAPT